MDLALLWDDWLIMAWLVPLSMAISGVIDVLMVQRRVFASAHEAAAISGLLGVAPLLVTPLWSDGPLFPDAPTIAIAIGAGAIYTWHILLYFKALFSANDVAYTEAFLSMAVLAVPLLSFLAFGEQLAPAHYAGIATATAGVAVMTYASGKHMLVKKSLTGLLTAAVLCVAISLVLEDAVFQRCDYWIGSFWFAVGGVLCSAVFAQRSGWRRIGRTMQRNRGALFWTNTTALFALVASLRATDLSESVSLVIVIETATPIIIMALSGTVLAAAHFSRALSAPVRVALHEQLTDAPVKLGSMSLILIGVMLVSVTSL